ncbi:MAG: zf-HC2 domain-containing protein [Gammaproteobacteria bacterium]
MQEQIHDPGLLAAFAEGRLDGEERQRVISHVADCLECRRTLAALGGALADGTLSQPSQGSATRPSRWSPPRVWLPIAASVLIASFAWFQFAGSPQRGIESDAPRLGEDLLTKRSAGRIVAGKTFRMTSGEWIDASFDPVIGMPTVLIRGTAERSSWLQRIPELTPYAGLGDRVTVVWQDTVYRFEP